MVLKQMHLISHGPLISFKHNRSPAKWWGGMILVLGLALAFTGGTSWAKLSSSESSQKLYAQAQKEYQNLLYSRTQNQYRQNWERVITRFESVLKQFPKTREGYKSVFTLGRLYQKLGKISGRAGDIDQALAYFFRLEKEFPADRLTDDALYFAGQLYLKRKNFSEARATFQKILTRYPKGDFVPKAKQQLQRPALKVPARAPAISPVLLKDLTFTSGSGETRVVLKAEGTVKYTQKTLQNPDRVYFDFRNARWGEHIPATIPVNDGRVQRLRMTQAKGVPSRLVLDLDGTAELEVVVQKSNNRLIIVIPHHKKKFVAVKIKSNVSKKRPVIRTAKSAVSKKIKANQKTPVVVLDAGHGGKDFGARGAHGLSEKDLNLQISKRVKKILEQRYHFKVIMTRKNDNFMELKDRGKIANRSNADLFVSIHANAAQRKSARGIETYYLGSGSTEQARETAARENGDLVHSVSDDTVQEILASLISTTKINDSSRLAASVQNSLHKTMSKKFSGIHNLGVKEGPFFVLHDTNMPSILVEVGFVTNPKEGRQLRNGKYQKWLAESIARGIHDYLKEKAPSI